MTVKVQLKREVDGVKQNVNPITSDECVVLQDGKKLSELSIATVENFVEENIIVEENLVDRVESIEEQLDSEFEKQNNKISEGLSNIEGVEQRIVNKVDTEINKTNAQLSEKVDNVIFDVKSNTLEFIADDNVIKKISLVEVSNNEAVQSYIDSLVFDGTIKGVELADNAVGLDNFDNKLSKLFVKKYDEYGLTLSDSGGYYQVIDGALNYVTQSGIASCELEVFGGEEYKLSSYNYYLARRYIILGDNDEVLAYDDNVSGSSLIENTIIKIPKGAKKIILQTSFEKRFFLLFETFSSVENLKEKIEELDTTFISEVLFKSGNLLNPILWEKGALSSSDGSIPEWGHDVYVRTSDYISVVGGKNIRFLINKTLNETFNKIRLFEYDKNKNFIDANTNCTFYNNDFSEYPLNTNTKFIKICIPEIPITFIENNWNGVSVSYAYFKANNFESYEDNKIYEFSESIIVKPSETLNILHNKIIAFSGDSICYGAGWRPAGNFNYLAYHDDMRNIDGSIWDYKNTGWSQIIAENNPTAKVYGYGIGGTTIQQNADLNTQYGFEQSIMKRIECMPDDLDYLILHGGINDCLKKLPLGSVSDMKSAYAWKGRVFDTYTFAGALEEMFRKAKTKYPNAKIGFIITPNVAWCNADDLNTDKGDFRLSNYRRLMIEACEKWDIPYYDLYSKSGITPALFGEDHAYFDSGDGLHPTELTYRHIANKIETWIKTL